MSRGINKVTLLGHLGKDPDVRSTAGGTIIATVSLATSDRRKGTNGDWEDQTEWHNLVMFNKTAEVCRDYLRKGSQVHIEGKIQTRSWEDNQTGQKHWKTEILVNELIMLGQPSGGAGASNGRAAQPEPSLPAYAGGGGAQPTQQGYTTTANQHGQFIEDDDIPF